MAGKDIYIGSMLENLQETMKAVENEMAESTKIQAEKLSDVNSILSQILTNTGLTKQQKVYSGADLTTVGLTTYKWREMWAGHDSLVIAPNKIYGDNAITSFICMFDLTNIKTVKVSLYFTHGSLTSGRFGGTLNCAGLSETISLSTTSTSTTEYQFDVSAKTGLQPFQFNYNTSLSNKQKGLFTITFVNDEGNELTNIFTELGGALTLANNVISCDVASGYGYTKFDFTSTAVASWSDAYIMGNLEGAKVYVVSEYGIDIYAEMNDAKTIDLSKYNGLSLYLLYELVEGNNISSIAFRYF